MFDDDCVEEKNDVFKRKVTYEGNCQKETPQKSTLKKHSKMPACVKNYKCKHCQLEICSKWRFKKTFNNTFWSQKV